MRGGFSCEDELKSSRTGGGGGAAGDGNGRKVGSFLREMKRDLYTPDEGGLREKVFIGRTREILR